jgi:hypothetical protein
LAANNSTIPRRSRSQLFQVASSPITRTPIVGAKNSIVGVKNSVGTRERLSNHINSSIFNELATIWVILLHPPPNFALKSANVAGKRVTGIPS